VGQEENNNNVLKEIYERSILKHPLSLQIRASLEIVFTGSAARN
jgi:hypothetical protein